MIIVHDVFVCKPGNASKLAKLLKEVMAVNPKPPMILTDMTGQYNRVVMVWQFDSLSAYEKSTEDYMNPSPEMKAAMKKMEGYTDLYMTGSREIFRIQ